MGALWKSSVKVHHMEELAEVMVNAARLKGAVIDEVKIGTLKNLSQAALKTFIKIACDPN